MFKLLYNFKWDPDKEKLNMRKHRISFLRSTTVFRDPNQISVFDEEHSINEDRWITFGLDENGILLAVIHTFKQTQHNVNIRIISARKATQTETKQYEEYN